MWMFMHDCVAALACVKYTISLIVESKRGAG